MIYRTAETARANRRRAAKSVTSAPAVNTQANRRRGKLQVLLAAGCAFGVFAGARMTHLHGGTDSLSLTEQALAGEWELQAVNNDPVGAQVDSVVLSQRVQFTGGKLHGETHLRGGTDAATSAMPFPDESVTQVTAPADGQEVVVTWEGTYALLDDKRVQLHIGGAQYVAIVTFDPRQHTLTLDHDTILTFKGPARYHALAPK